MITLAGIWDFYLNQKHIKKSAFTQGLLSNVLNPKVVVFFLRSLPQFVQTGRDATLQFLLMGVTYTLLAITFLKISIFFINYLRNG